MKEMETKHVAGNGVNRRYDLKFQWSIENDEKTWKTGGSIHSEIN